MFVCFIWYIWCKVKFIIIMEKNLVKWEGENKKSYIFRNCKKLYRNFIKKFCIYKNSWKILVFFSSGCEVLFYFVYNDIVYVLGSR